MDVYIRISYTLPKRFGGSVWLTGGDPYPIVMGEYDGLEDAEDACDDSLTRVRQFGKDFNLPERPNPQHFGPFPQFLSWRRLKSSRVNELGVQTIPGAPWSHYRDPLFRNSSSAFIC